MRINLSPEEWTAVIIALIGGVPAFLTSLAALIVAIRSIWTRKKETTELLTCQTKDIKQTMTQKANEVKEAVAEASPSDSVNSQLVRALKEIAELKRLKQ